MRDRDIARAMRDLLSAEPAEADVFEWLRNNRDRIAQIGALCEKTPFHETISPRRRRWIAELDALAEATNAEKAVFVWVDMIEVVAKAPSFVSPECVAVANLPIVLKYLDAAIAENNPPASAARSAPADLF